MPNITTCTSPPEVANGFVSYDSLSGGPTWSGEVTYNCFRFYGLVGSNKLTCNSGYWEGTMPICEHDRDTEILFWFLIALVVVLVLVLVMLIIFVCCYFGRCCGSGKVK